MRKSPSNRPRVQRRASPIGQAACRLPACHVRHPEHAVFDRAVFHTGRRSRAARATFDDDGEIFRLLLARWRDALGAWLLLKLVGHHPGALTTWDSAAMAAIISLISAFCNQS